LGILQLGMRRLVGSMARVGFVLAVVVAAGCGGGETGPAPPRLPHALGARLAESASAVQASLTRGDACEAAAEAVQLRQMVQSAIASGQVPAALRTPLSGSVGSLVDEITCIPPPSPPAKKGDGPPGHRHPPGHEHRPGHDHKHGHGHDGDRGKD
jgi:hypothetical protein